MVDISKLFKGDGLAVRGMSLLKRSNHRNPLIKKYAIEEFAQLLCKPLREGIFSQDVISQIFPCTRIK